MIFVLRFAVPCAFEAIFELVHTRVVVASDATSDPGMGLAASSLSLLRLASRRHFRSSPALSQSPAGPREWPRFFQDWLVWCKSMFWQRNNWTVGDKWSIAGYRSSCVLRNDCKWQPLEGLCQLERFRHAQSPCHPGLTNFLIKRLA
jgi:hypothetical protein